METTTIRRMGPREQAVARLLADAGFRFVRDVHRVIEQTSSGLADEATVRRYLYNPPERRDIRVLRALASALGASVDEIEDLPPAESATARYLTHAERRSFRLPVRPRLRFPSKDVARAEDAHIGASVGLTA